MLAATLLKPSWLAPPPGPSPLPCRHTVNGYHHCVLKSVVVVGVATCNHTVAYRVNHDSTYHSLHGRQRGSERCHVVRPTQAKILTRKQECITTTVKPLYCGPGGVSCIERCPHFRDRLIFSKHIEVSIKRGSTVVSLLGPLLFWFTKEGASPSCNRIKMGSGNEATIMTSVPLPAWQENAKVQSCVPYHSSCFSRSSLFNCHFHEFLKFS